MEDQARAVIALKRLPSQLDTLLQHVHAHPYSPVMRAVHNSCYDITNVGQDATNGIMMGLMKGGMSFMLSNRPLTAEKKSCFKTRVRLSAFSLWAWGRKTHKLTLIETEEKLLLMVDDIWAIALQVDLAMHVPMPVVPSAPITESVAESNHDLPVRSNCSICMQRPITQGFMHGNSVHACACLPCAQAVMAMRPCCPLCREVSQLVDVFTC